MPAAEILERAQPIGDHPGLRAWTFEPGPKVGDEVGRVASLALLGISGLGVVNLGGGNLGLGNTGPRNLGRRNLGV